jgi:hypothetical protein
VAVTRIRLRSRSTSAHRSAIASPSLRPQHQLYTAPVRVEGEGAEKSVLPLGPWSLYLNGKDPEDAFVEIWDEHTDAPALALVCGSRFGVVALDADTAEAEGYVLERRVPRTPTWRSTRGLHWLFRPGSDELTSGRSGLGSTCSPSRSSR